MALKLAGFSLDEGRHVVMFFNVKGVTIPSNAFADDFAFQEDKPIKAQLADLIQRTARPIFNGLGISPLFANPQTVRSDTPSNFAAVFMSISGPLSSGGFCPP